MGANAQTTVPTFTAGQVLTAAQMNNSARTGVPVFADTTARDAAFGGTGEKTLAEGQLCYVENLTGVAQIQYYDGAAWVSLTSPSLVVVKAETAFTAASSVTADNIFSATYRTYKMVINYTTSTTNRINARLRVGGTSTSTTTYNSQSLDADNTTISGGRGSSETSVGIATSTNGAFNSSCEVMIYNPFIATPTTFASTQIYSSGAYTSPGINIRGGNQSGSTSFDGIELLVSTGTMTGNYTIYGLATA